MMNHKKEADFPAVFTLFFLTMVVAVVVIIGPEYSWELAKITAKHVAQGVVKVWDLIIFWV